MANTAPISAGVVVGDREPRHLRLTLSSLMDQNAPPAEVFIIDTLPGEARFEVKPPSGGCSHCGGVNEMLGKLDARIDRADVVNAPGEGKQDAQRRLESLAGEKYLWDLESGSVILTPEWTEVAVERLEAPDEVVGVGGNAVESLSGSPTGEAATFLRTVGRRPSGGECLVYSRWALSSADGSLHERLRRSGEVCRDGRLAAALDLPSPGQNTLKNVVMGAAVSAVVSAAMNAAYDRFVRRAV